MTALAETRRALHEQIVAGIERDPAAVAEFAGLSEVDQAWMLYHRALDRLAKSECAGFVKRRPGNVVALDAAKLKPGIG